MNLYLLRKFTHLIKKPYLHYLLVFILSGSYGIIYAQTNTTSSTTSGVERLKPVKKLLNKKQKHDKKIGSSVTFEEQESGTKVFKIVPPAAETVQDAASDISSDVTTDTITDTLPPPTTITLTQILIEEESNTCIEAVDLGNGNYDLQPKKCDSTKREQKFIYEGLTNTMLKLDIKPDACIDAFPGPDSSDGVQDYDGKTPYIGICNETNSYQRFKIHEVNNNIVTKLSLEDAAAQNVLFKNNQNDVRLIRTTQATIVKLSDFISNKTAMGDLIIPKDKVVEIDSTQELGIIHVKGQLVCPETGDYTITTKGILVDGNNAKLACGTPTAPYNGKIKFVFTGNTEISNVLMNMNDNHSITHDSNNLLGAAGMDSHTMGTHEMGTKALVAHNGGTISLFGKPGKSGYFKITKTVNPGDTKIILSDTVENWEIGDEIVVAPSGFDPNQAEQFTITSIAADKKTLTLNSPFKYLHWGETEIHSNGKGKSWVLDERAEVINLTRNIKIMSADDEYIKTNIPTGAHTMAMGAGSKLFIDNTEFYRVGQMAKMGRYPIHWHRRGNVDGQFLTNNSIHESYNRCITIHSTQYGLVSKNSCYDHVGHGLFLEDGNETNNVITHNITVLTKRPKDPLHETALLHSDHIIVPTRFVGPASYWISNPNNVVQYNVAAGSQGGGFWMSFSSGLYCEGNYCERNPEKGVNYFPFRINTKVFSDNVAHSTLLAFSHDGTPDGALTNNPLNPMDRVVDAVHYSPTEIPIFNNLVAYKNHTGIYYRGNKAIYNNNIVADNNLAFFVAFDQEVVDSVIVGLSKNSKQEEVDYATTPEPWKPWSMPFYGIWVYDGPFYLNNVHFSNYSDVLINNSSGKDVTPIPIYVVGGANYAINATRNITFNPIPLKKFGFNYGERIWNDSYSQIVKDLDGTFTGLAGSLLRPNHYMNNTKDCSEIKENALICNYEAAILQFLELNEQGQIIDYFRTYFDVERTSSDGHVALIERSKDLNNKLSLIMNKGFTYKVKNLTGKKFLVHLITEEQNEVSPIIILENMPATCELEFINRFNSLEELKQATTAGFYHDGKDFYMKTQSTIKVRDSHSKGFNGYRLNCI